MPTLSTYPLRIAHISDLHFAKLTWNPSQLLSKRWLGNLNVLLSRKKNFAPDTLSSLVPLLHEKNVATVLITGDLSSTSHPEEFLMAWQFVDHLKKEGFSVFTLPGNHDHYTKSAYRQRLFYDFFSAQYAEQAEQTLKTEGVTATQIADTWWIIGLDTALATSLLSSNGLFSSAIEEQLEQMLGKIPQGHSVILMNHFPVFSNETFRKSLLRKEALKKVLERHPQIKLFLHGHTHRHSIADLRASHLPIILDSGSTGLKQGGSWNFIEITEKGCTIEGFKNKSQGSNISWERFIKSSFKWSDNGALV